MSEAAGNGAIGDGAFASNGAFGAVRQPVGSRIPTAAPSNAYPTRDGKWILIAANSEPLFARLATLIGRPELTSDPRFRSNQARVQNVDALDAAIAEWSRTVTAAEADERITAAGVPCTQIYTAKECAEDAQFRQRGMVQEVENPQFGRPVLHAGVVPYVAEMPGVVRWPGPSVGAHTREVLEKLLGLSPAEVGALQGEGAV